MTTTVMDHLTNPRKATQILTRGGARREREKAHR